MDYTLLVVVSLCECGYLYCEKDVFKKTIIGVSIFITIFFTGQIHSLLILFLPMNLYEIVSYYINEKWLIFLIMILPIMFIDESVQMTYGLIATFGFLIFTMANLYTARLLKLEMQNDTIRKICKGSQRA